MTSSAFYSREPAPVQAVRPLNFRYYPRRPHEITEQRLWVVELLLDRAHDTSDPQLVEALCALNPAADETIHNWIERLYDLADEAAAAAPDATVRYYRAVTAYCEQLRSLAQLIASVRAAA